MTSPRPIPPRVYVSLVSHQLGFSISAPLQLITASTDPQHLTDPGGRRFDSHPGRVVVSLSKTPYPQLLLLTSWLVPCMAVERRVCMSV